MDRALLEHKEQSQLMQVYPSALRPSTGKAAFPLPASNPRPSTSRCPVGHRPDVATKQQLARLNALGYRGGAYLYQHEAARLLRLYKKGRGARPR